MRLITEQRGFTRIQRRLPVQWRRLLPEEHDRWCPLFVQQPTDTRRRSYAPGMTEIPGYLSEQARPAELAILQSLKQLHQKLDRLLEILSPHQNSELSLTGESVDVSASGLRFVSEHSAERGEYLMLFFALPAEHGGGPSAGTWRPSAQPIEVLARVVSCTKQDSRHTLAISFTAIHPDDQQTIQRYCEKHLGR